MKSVILIILLPCFSMMAMGQTKLAFQMEWNGHQWHPDSIYQNAAGETLQINRLQFYTSQWKYINANNDTIDLSTAHFLMNAFAMASLSLPFDLPKNAKTVLFNVGVEKDKNTSGIQTGVLDPALGMFWTWRSGYIMAKLHGVSPNAKTAGNRFSYEVGGFEPPFDAVRTIVLNLPSGKGSSNQTIIHTNLAAWFNGKHPIQISQTPNCHNAGKLAMLLADNYATLFSIVNYP